MRTNTIILTAILALTGCGNNGSEEVLPESTSNVDGGGLEPQGDACTCVGETGAQGLAGETGPAGADGIDGVDGADGAEGPAGVAGPAGERGEQGEVGPQGPAGAQGPMGLASTVPGPAGAQGARGETGPAGEPGAPGESGEVGPQGPAGEVGPAGEAGPAGQTGARGATGAQGPQGNPGPAGLIDPSRLYVASGSTDAITPPAAGSTVQVSIYADCDEGDIAISGGCTMTFPTQVHAQLRQSYGTDISGRWVCDWDYQGGVPQEWFTAKVLCLDITD